MNYLDYLVKNHPVRNSKAEKDAFRNYVINEAESMGYKAYIEETADKKNKNIVIGNVNTAKAVYCAHFDTPFRSLFPNLMIPRNKLLFFLYQFIPVTLILLCSYIPAMLLADRFFTGDMNIIAFEVIFFILYFGLFYLLYFAFKNKNNHNDNTSGVAAILSIMKELKDKENAAFILFDNEEKGKLGSKAYFKDHKDVMEDKLLINFDCVGNGNNIVIIAMKEAEKSDEYKILKEVFAADNNYSVSFYGSKGSECNSDHKNFPKGIAVMACKNTKKGLLYTPKIHTSKDTEANNENISFITKRMAEFTERI